MRKIAFRVWDKPEERMLYNIMVGGFKETVPLWWDSIKGDWVHLTDNSNLMQFTGLKDKNGKEIYENDYILYNNKTYKIIWGFCGFRLQEENNPQSISIPNVHKMEVIGNEYEG